MFIVPKTGTLLKVERYKVNGRVMAVFAQSVAESEIYCAALPDCEFTGNQNRKFYRYAYSMYGLSKSDFYGIYYEHDSCYERIVEKQFSTKHLYIVGSEAYLKAIAEEWENHLIAEEWENHL